MNTASSHPGPIEKVDHVLGPPSAKVSVIEYGDFECPSCGQAHAALKIILKHFGEDVRFAFRNFPLSEVHPHAEHAAEAAEAAGAQGKFWQMYDLLFTHQLHLKDNNLRQYALELELDMQRYDFELRDQVYMQRVREHLASGKQAGVRATPAFFVSGEATDVSFGLEHLRQAIETALHK
jgi:protein-disulfide isomerase